MNKSLVIGASGLVGMHLVKSLASAGQAPFATYYSYQTPSAISLDIRQLKDVEMVFMDALPSVVYLPAAFSNVDYCETHPAETYEINVTGLKNVVQAANALGAKLVYFSSDYIFDGKSGPYEETDTANPINEYGRQKLSAEQHISLCSKDYLIVRTTIIYGWEQQEKNFVYRLVKALKAGLPIKVPTDQIGTPTYANDLAQSVIKLSQINLNSIVNVAGPNCISRYEFALEVAGIFDLPQDLIQPVATKELNQPAPRPLMAGLKTEKAYSLLKTLFAPPGIGLQNMQSQQTHLSTPR